MLARRIVDGIKELIDCRSEWNSRECFSNVGNGDVHVKMNTKTKKWKAARGLT